MRGWDQDTAACCYCLQVFGAVVPKPQAGLKAQRHDQAPQVDLCCTAACLLQQQLQHARLASRCDWLRLAQGFQSFGEANEAAWRILDCDQARSNIGKQALLPLQTKAFWMAQCINGVLQFRA